MTKNLINEIIVSLISETNSGNLIWKLRYSIFNSETEHNMHCFSEDKQTEFRISIRLDNDTLNLSPGSLLFIHNEKITDGKLHLSNRENINITELEKIIFDKFVQTIIKPRHKKEDVFEDILNSIGSKQSNRDKKIDQILNKKSWKLW